MPTRSNVKLGSDETLIVELTNINGVAVLTVNSDNATRAQNVNPLINNYEVKFEKLVNGSYSEIYGSPISVSTNQEKNWVTGNVGNGLRVTITNKGNIGYVNLSLDEENGGSAFKALHSHVVVGQNVNNLTTLNEFIDPGGTQHLTNIGGGGGSSNDLFKDSFFQGQQSTEGGSDGLYFKSNLSALYFTKNGSLVYSKSFDNDIINGVGSGFSGFFDATVADNGGISDARSVFLNGSEDTLFVCSVADSAIYEYPIGNNPATAQGDLQATYDFSSDLGSGLPVISADFNTNGSELYVVGTSTLSIIVKYNLSTNYDISSRTLADAESNPTFQLFFPNDPKDIFVDSQNSILYVIGGGNGENICIKFDISNGLAPNMKDKVIDTRFLSGLSGGNTLTGFWINKSQNKMWVHGGESTGYLYQLGL